MTYSRPIGVWLFAIAAISVFAVASAQAQQLIEKIEVLVNDEPISAYDVNQRLRLVVAAAGQVEDEDELNRLREQVMRTMVDERLQMQEAAELEVEVTEQELAQVFARIAQNFNQTPDQFSQFLRNIGTSERTLLSQIRAEQAWGRVVSRQFGPQIQVSDEEVDDVIERLEDNAGKFEFLVSEIFLIVDNPRNEPAVRQTAEQLVERLRGGAQFETLARQFSEAASAATGGNLGWVPEGRFDPTLDAAIKALEVGKISDPIRSPGGFRILGLRDRRRILSVDPLDMQLNLRMIAYPFDSNNPPPDLEDWIDKVEALRPQMTSCSEISDYNQQLGRSEVLNVGDVTLRDLPPQIQGLVDETPIGQPTKPIIATDGARLIFVCGRTEPEVRKPDFNSVLAQLEEQRLSLMARRYLRDLRRDAIVDYR